MRRSPLIPGGRRQAIWPKQPLFLLGGSSRFPRPPVAQRDVSSEPIGSIGHFTPIVGLLTTSWAWFQDRTRQIAQSKPRACLREILSRGATHGPRQHKRRVECLS